MVRTWTRIIWLWILFVCFRIIVFFLIFGSDLSQQKSHGRANGVTHLECSSALSLLVSIAHERKREREGARARSHRPNRTISKNIFYFNGKTLRVNVTKAH